MSKPRYKWWGYAKAVIRSYPELREELMDLQSQRTTRDITAVAGSNSLTRNTENAALKQLPPARQAEYDAISKAIEQTQRLRNGKDRLALIEKVYWKQSHTLEGAAYALGYSYDRAKQLHREFVRLVGFNRGLED